MVIIVINHAKEDLKYAEKPTNHTTQLVIAHAPMLTNMHYIYSAIENLLIFSFCLEVNTVVVKGILFLSGMYLLNNRPRKTPCHIVVSNLRT